MICPKCGFQNRPGAKFCKRDGQPLVQGAAIAPPQIRTQVARGAIQARPVPQPIRARPVQANTLQARPVPSNALQARPPGTPASSDPTAAYRLGLQNLSNKKYTDAINQFKLAQNRGGPSYDILYNLGRAYRQYGQAVRETDRQAFKEQMTQAAQYFNEALRLKPDALDAHFQLGMCYRDLTLYAQATSAFKKALALTPRDPAIHYQLGLVALEQGNMREAEVHFQDGLRINPDHVLILVAQGRLYLEQKQALSAVKVLRQATAIDPLLWEGWYELGRAHMREKEWTFALSALERARKEVLYAPEVFTAMATCYLKLNRKVEARQMVNEVLQRDPKNAEAIRLKKQL